MRSRRGFSLLEALVAFVILTTSLAVLWPALIQMTSRSSSERSQVLAMQLAASQLATIGVSEPFASTTGEWQSMIWQVDVTEQDPATPEGKLFGKIWRIEIVVHDRTNGQELARSATIKLESEP